MAEPRHLSSDISQHAPQVALLFHTDTWTGEHSYASALAGCLVEETTDRREHAWVALGPAEPEPRGEGEVQLMTAVRDELLTTPPTMLGIEQHGDELRRALAERRVHLQVVPVRSQAAVAEQVARVFILTWTNPWSR
jgi:hypothetical protein